MSHGGVGTAATGRRGTFRCRAWKQRCVAPLGMSGVLVSRSNGGVGRNGRRRREVGVGVGPPDSR